MPILKGPTYKDNLWTLDPLFIRYSRPSGITLLVLDGVVTETTYPFLGDLLEIPWDYIYLGGHVYTLTPIEVEILTNAGYGIYIHPDEEGPINGQENGANPGVPF